MVAQVEIIDSNGPNSVEPSLKGDTPDRREPVNRAAIRAG